MKRILCTLLAAMFALSCLPVTVFAGEEGADSDYQQALERRVSQIAVQSENTPPPRKISVRCWILTPIGCLFQGTI